MNNESMFNTLLTFLVIVNVAPLPETTLTNDSPTCAPRPDPKDHGADAQQGARLWGDHRQHHRQPPGRRQQRVGHVQGPAVHLPEVGKGRAKRV